MSDNPNEVPETETPGDTAVEETPEVTTDQSINNSLDEIDDPDTLRKMVAKLRRENANHRTKKNASEAELAEFRKWKEAQMTELERAQKRAEELEKKYQEKVREGILREFGIDDDLAEFVTGSEEEMRARAEKLGKRKTEPSGEEKRTVNDVFSAPRGNNPLKKQIGGGSFLEALADGQPFVTG